jgi:hypothetical protein
MILIYRQGFKKFGGVMRSQTAALLDLYPVLRALPDFALPMRRHVKNLHEEEKELYVGHWLNVKRGIKNGTARPCFCLDLIRAQDEEKFSDAQAGYISGGLLEAGSDSTAATLVGCTYVLMFEGGHADHLKLSKQWCFSLRSQKPRKRSSVLSAAIAYQL